MAAGLVGSRRKDQMLALLCLDPDYFLHFFKMFKLIVVDCKIKYAGGGSGVLIAPVPAKIF